MASRSGSTSGANLSRELRQFRQDLKALHGQWPRALSDVHRDVAQVGAKASQGKARSMGGIQAKGAKAIKGRGNLSGARIGISGGKRIPYANVAFWGAKKRTGWFARYRYRNSSTPRQSWWRSGATLTQQHPPWVGNTWDAARKGQGPYAINEALAEHLDEIGDLYGKAIDDLAAKAFPKGG